MGVRHTSWDLDGFEIGPGWSWDANFGNLMEVIRHLDGGEMQISGHGCEVKRNLGEWPGWRWDRALIEVHHTASDLGVGETWPGLRWHMNIGTWMELRHCLEGGVMWLYGPGLGWDSTCMEVRLKSLDPDPDEIGPGWRWDTYLESLMALWGCLYGAEVQFLGLGWRWDVTWMEMRHKHKDLDWSEKPHGWKVGMNQCNWGEVRRKSRDLAEDEMGPGLSWDTHL